MENKIFLIDMNAFFASVEQAVNPALRGKPVLVCGEGRTIVTAASYEAKAFGVKTGMTPYEARKICPGAITVVGDMHKYAGSSRNIQEILLRFTALVEPYSIDECFLDATSLCRNGKTAKDIAMEIKRLIKDELHLLCSIGIGPNKVVSKLASKMQKPDGLVEICKADIPRVFENIPVEKLQGVGIGRKISEKLKSLGIMTAKQLGEANENFMMFHFGIYGWHLKRIGLGEDSSTVKEYSYSEREKSFGHSHTLPKDTYDIQTIRSYLLMLCEKAAARLRQAGLSGKTVHFYVRYGDFTGFGRQKSLAHYIEKGTEIFNTAIKIFEECLPLAKPVRLVGVSISNLTDENGQTCFLDDINRDKDLTGVVDEINNKYGELTIKPSSLLIAENFGIQDRCGLIGKYHFKPGFCSKKRAMSKSDKLI
jgi:DNA polymerase-4